MPAARNLWWEVDVTYYGLRMLNWLGIARDLRGVRLPLSEAEAARSRIAVVGAGISGMAAGLPAEPEARSLPAGERRSSWRAHPYAPIPTSRGVSPIDTGFIVHNDRTYPNLVKLFRKLGVERQKSDMSFGVSCRKTGFEYSSRGLGGLFAEKKQLVALATLPLSGGDPALQSGSPKAAAGSSRRKSLSESDLSRIISAQTSARYYLHPMAAAVWSTSPEEIEEFPGL